jgi:uncharacterized protein (TIGR02246 family)
MPIDLQHVADHMALRELVATYAHGVDRRDAHGVAALFTEDGRLASYHGDAVTPVNDRRGRDQIAAAMETMDRYLVTTHFLGQQNVVIDGDRATGETYCLAHHLYHEADDDWVNRVISIRYLDAYVRAGDNWLFFERRIVADWIEHRPWREGVPRRSPALP